MVQIKLWTEQLYNYLQAFYFQRALRLVNFNSKMDLSRYVNKLKESRSNYLNSRILSAVFDLFSSSPPPIKRDFNIKIFFQTVSMCV